MEKLNYDSIRFHQFVEFLPNLKIDKEVKFFLPELILMTFPVYDGDEVRCHIVSGFRVEREQLLIWAIGCLKGIQLNNFETLISDTTYCDIHEACLFSGRVNDDYWMTISTFGGSLCLNECFDNGIHDIQQIGKILLRGFYCDSPFLSTKIGEYFFLTPVMDDRFDIKVQDQSVTPSKVNSPPM